MVQSADDIKELAYYLKNIRSFEAQYIRSERSTMGMIWGIFIIIAGLIDGYVASLPEINYSPHGIIWFLAIAGAILTQQIVSSQPLLYDKEFSEGIERQKMSTWEIILIILIMIGATLISLINIAFVMIYIGLSFGFLNLITQLVANKKINWSQTGPIHAFFISSIVLIVLYIINQNTMKYFGLIFGLIVGGVSFFRGYRGRNRLELD